MVRETWDHFVFQPFNSLHRSPATFLVCEEDGIYDSAAAKCVSVCRLQWLVMLYIRQGECWESVAIQSAFLIPCVLPYTHRAASQFYTMLRCIVDIPYSCHTTLIPLARHQRCCCSSLSFLDCNKREQKKLDAISSLTSRTLSIHKCILIELYLTLWCWTELKCSKMKYFFVTLHTRLCATSRLPRKST